MKNNSSYFQNKSCEYFPCHKCDGEYFNCLFCYCPLYMLGDKCGGNFKFLENGTKDCSLCMIPHSENAFCHIKSKQKEIEETIRKNNLKKEL